jgi:carbonic anhydrase
MPTAKILTGIHAFEGHYEERRELFGRLATEGQSPEVLFISCSDSRVPPELITGSDPGDLFVLRLVANIVPPYGVGQEAVGAAIEYSILQLGIRQIVICGHTDCGGVKALDDQPDWSRAPHIARWIEHARPAKTQVEARGVAEADRHLAIVRENVLLQLDRLRSYDPVCTAERAGSLTLHGWVYHLESGKIEAWMPETKQWSALQGAE